jgi:hypothetical protein
VLVAAVDTNCDSDPELDGDNCFLAEAGLETASTKVGYGHYSEVGDGGRSAHGMYMVKNSRMEVEGSRHVTRAGNAENWTSSERSWVTRVNLITFQGVTNVVLVACVYTSG